MANVELVRGRNRQLELFSVAHDIEGLVVDDGVESNHPQLVGPADKNVSSDLLEVSYFAAFFTTHRGVDVNCGIQSPDLSSVLIQPIDQFLLRRRLQLGAALEHFHRTGTEKATASAEQ